MAHRCFSRLTIVRCKDQLQLTVALRAFAGQPAHQFEDVRMIALDTLDCFYYVESQQQSKFRSMRIELFCELNLT